MNNFAHDDDLAFANKTCTLLTYCSHAKPGDDDEKPFTYTKSG